MFLLEKPTKAKLQKTDDKGIKVGQKDLKPAVIVNLSVVLPNTALEMFDTALRAILYGKGTPGAKERKQTEMEGMDMVKDLPSLTKTGQRLASLHWGEEQSGCTLTLDYGLGDERANITLKDATTKDFKVTLNEGGAIKVGFRVHAPVEHLSLQQLGQLHLMHQRDVKITLAGPAVDQQQEIEEDDADTGDAGAASTPPAVVKSRRGGGAALTPIKALEKSQKNADAANAAGKARA